MRTWLAFGLLPALLAPLLSSGCKPTKPPAEELGYGAIERSVYTNAYFGLSFQIPHSWHVKSQAEWRDRLKREAADLARRSPASRHTAEAAGDRSLLLISISQKPPGSPPPNASIDLHAERLVTPAARGAEVLRNVRESLRTGYSATFSREIHSVQIDGAPFDVLELRMPVSGQTVRQKIYCTILKGYALAFTLTWVNPGDEPNLSSIVQHARFQIRPSSPAPPK